MRHLWSFFVLSIACSGGATDDTTDTDSDVVDTEPDIQWECQIPEGKEDPPAWSQVGCMDDWLILSAPPADASIPGARSAKTVVDRSDGNALYIQNSNRYAIHWEFAFENLSGNGLPIVPDLGSFNTTEYYSPQRRFLLGAITHYEEPGVWAYEISPYDTSSAEMIETTYRLLKENTFFGRELYVHPTSAAVEVETDKLPEDIPIISTDELFDGITYQPLNLGTSFGQLRFYTTEEVDEGFVNYREIVVLDAVPNDISVVAGIITDEFQTPLSHINVLSQNRGTPNMGLKDAYNNEELRALEGKWVEFTVEANGWTIREATVEEADKWWKGFRPEPLEVTPMDISVDTFVNDEDILDLENLSLSDAISEAIPAFGGKASNFGAMSTIPDLPHPDGFAIPMYFYHQHMTENDLWDDLDAMLADKDFQSDARIRSEQLAAFQQLIMDAPVNADTLAALTTKLDEEFPGVRMRFRSSTNAEDLGDFTGAGLYTSQSGTPGDPDETIEDAMRTVWASVWGSRAYEEREYYGIDHVLVGMTLLVHPSFPDEEANGVAITANPFDPVGLEPAFYVNVQLGEESVVQPEPGVFSDQFLYYHTLPGSPITYIAHSNLVPPGLTVLTPSQVFELGEALQAIHLFFAPAYQEPGRFYAMDTEFKFDGDWGQTPTLYMKQARPYPGRGQ